MGTWNAFYVRRVDEVAMKQVRLLFDAAPVDSNGEFIGVRLSDDAFDHPSEILERLSRDLSTDVLCLGFQSLVDAFQFFHWRDGQSLRALVYGCHGPEERTWERADGTAEPWEESVFFDLEELNYAVETAGENPKREEGIRRIWRDRVFTIGEGLPSVDSRECAHKIAAHYGLPHYG